LEGGGSAAGVGSATVDIFDFSLGSWKTGFQSEARWLLTATSLGDLALFGGGENGGYTGGGVSARVDIFNSSTVEFGQLLLSLRLVFGLLLPLLEI